MKLSFEEVKDYKASMNALEHTYFSVGANPKNDGSKVVDLLDAYSDPLRNNVDHKKRDSARHPTYLICSQRYHNRDGLANLVP